MIFRSRGQVLLALAGLAVCWGATGSGSFGLGIAKHSAEITGALRCAAAVILVGLATGLVMAAVRGVSSRPVTRPRYRPVPDDEDPPLPFHKPEPEEPEEDVWTAMPPSRQAAPLPLPGRAPAAMPERTMAPEPGYREVPR